MSIDAAFARVTEIMPPFNDYLLKDYRKNNIDNIPEFMSTIFREAIKLHKGDLKYLGYKRMTPEERLSYFASQRQEKNKINIQQNEMILMKFMFEYCGEPIEVPLYVPYLYDNALIVNSTKFYIHLAIIERMIYHITDGIIIKVMRSPLHFWRNKQLTYENTDGKRFYDTIVTMRAHFRKNSTKKSTQTPLVLYLLAHYEFNEALSILGIPPGAVSFVSSVPSEEERNPETDRFYYFKCHENVYLKVDHEQIYPEGNYNLNSRVIASLIYILKMTKTVDLDYVTDTKFYMSILGRNLYPNVNNSILACDHAKSHLDSLSTYLDEYTKAGLEELKIYCNDIFDLFVNVFVMIDEWSTRYEINDLFSKRIGGTDLLLIEVVKQVFNRFYEAQRKHKNIKLQSVTTMLRLPVMSIPKQCTRVDSVHSDNNQYNDNDLYPILIKRIRQSSGKHQKNNNIMKDKEHKFHPSFVALESVLAISQSRPGITGDINPYAQIDEHGNFLQECMPWYSEVEGLKNYLFKA